jgi:hypothetical protein
MSSPNVVIACDSGLIFKTEHAFEGKCQTTASMEIGGVVHHVAWDIQAAQPFELSLEGRANHVHELRLDIYSQHCALADPGTPYT